VKIKKYQLLVPEKCSTFFRDFLFMSYLELLRHPKWQKKAADIKYRDDWTCRTCGDKETNLQVHHLYYTYDVMPWDYPDDAMITLCDLCHKKAEFIKWLVRHGVNLLISKGFLKRDVAEIRSLIERRVELNMHRESAEQYMNDIKLLING
jgi:hypothetical protein